MCDYFILAILLHLAGNMPYRYHLIFPFTKINLNPCWMSSVSVLFLCSPAYSNWYECCSKIPWSFSSWANRPAAPYPLSVFFLWSVSIFYAKTLLFFPFFTSATVSFIRLKYIQQSCYLFQPTFKAWSPLWKNFGKCAFSSFLFRYYCFSVFSQTFSFLCLNGTDLNVFPYKQWNGDKRAW